MRPDATDPRCSGATLGTTAAAWAGLRIRTRARLLADSAGRRAERASDPLLEADLRELQRDALELAGLASLASALPRLSRWALIWRLLGC